MFMFFYTCRQKRVLQLIVQTISEMLNVNKKVSKLAALHLTKGIRMENVYKK